MLFDEIDLQSHAILLDIDGTILDIAPTPFDVQVPPLLECTLAKLSEKTRGALALVSGRSLSDIDCLFNPLLVAAIGGHGAEVRIPRSTVDWHLDLNVGDKTRKRLEAFAGQTEGVILEDKGYSLALHFRLAPQHAETVRLAMTAAAADYPPATVELLPGKDVIEIKPVGFNKGGGIRELMHHAPFRGRRPIFVGDDVSDESAFAVMPEFGGLGFSVGKKVAGLAGWFATPADVRRWLQAIASTYVAEARSVS